MLSILNHFCMVDKMYLVSCTLTKGKDILRVIVSREHERLGGGGLPDGVSKLSESSKQIHMLTDSTPILLERTLAYF